MFGAVADGRCLIVDAGLQILLEFDAGAVLHEYPVSTSRHGLGCRSGSYRTPVGWHRIAERIGEGCRQGEVFVGRQPQNRLIGSMDAGTRRERDWITSRILWLDGIEAGLNRGGDCDSHARYIYIHGTADEASIGRPASIGCVRMRNADVIDLFARIAVGTPVFIGDRLAGPVN